MSFRVDPDKNSGVYAVSIKPQGQDWSWMKIGVSSNVSSRISSLQTGSPYSITPCFLLRAPSPISYTIESDLHLIVSRALGVSRFSGEWFPMHRFANDIDAMNAFSCLFLYAGYKYGYTPYQVRQESSESFWDEIPGFNWLVQEGVAEVAQEVWLGWFYKHIWYHELSKMNLLRRVWYVITMPNELRQMILSDYEFIRT